MKIKIFYVAMLFLIVILSYGCSKNNNDTSSGGGGGASPMGFQALLGPTFTNPRCTNCHAFDEGNTTSVSHADRSDDCNSCHGKVLSNWRAPFRSFSFSGLSTEQICTSMKNKTANDINLLRDRLINSSMTLWGVSSGRLPSGRAPTAPPGSVGAWISLVNMWVDNGAICD